MRLTFVASHTCTVSYKSKVKRQKSKWFYFNFAFWFEHTCSKCTSEWHNRRWSKNKNLATKKILHLSIM